MIDSRKWRWAVWVAVLAAFIAISTWFSWLGNNSCMGVQVLSQKKMAALGEYAYIDFSLCLEFNGELAAVDVESSTIYLSQDITEGTCPEDLPGTLTVTCDGYSLGFAPDPRFQDLAAAVEEGHAFRLLVISNWGVYMEYQVVFTTLPVMRLDGLFSHMNHEERAVMQGDVCLWAPNDPATGRYSVKTSGTEWRVRGGTTVYLEKNSWKLSLKKKNGENNDVDFLGQGADDDWILNPMIIDDTKVKEKLFMQLWNDWAKQAPWNYPMSTGEYVELVIDQSYRGVHLLQKRIDKKYLKLQGEDALLKGNANYAQGGIEEAFEIIDSPLSEIEMFALMEGIFTGRDTSPVDLNNFLDTTLFLNFGAAVDNAGYKNMYYLLLKEEDGYRYSLLPWDTDMSWGMLWDGELNWYGYSYDNGMAVDLKRYEYGVLKGNVPTLDQLLAERWKLLRQNVLSEETVFSILDKMVDELQYSGAIKRDKQRWGLFFDGQDTVENLYRFLQERLWKLDVYYSEFLQ